MSEPILVIDLEATCSEDDSIPPANMEIIEVGAVWATPIGETLESFQGFVRPVVNRHLTGFCTNLTGISQDTVDSAPAWPIVVADLADFARLHDSRTWASWGAYDAKQVEIDCARHGVENPLADWRHINLKKEFARVQKTRRVGMKMALLIVGLPLEGKHHSGIDDARNIAKLVPYCFARP